MKIENYKLKINNRGFTLVELLIYTGIFAVVSGLMIGILTTTLRVNQRESASAEATSQLNFILQTIQRLTRESSAIIVNSSSTNFDTDDTVGSQQTRLVLRMKDSVGNNSTDRDPIVIYAENNVIKLSEGRGAYQRISDLTNSRVLADNLKFTKYTQYPGHDTVAVDIQLTYNSQNPDSRVSRTLRTAIARVSAATFDSNLLPGADNTYEIGYLAGNQRWKNISVSNLISTSNLLNLGQLTNDPSSDVQNGSIYYNTASSTFRGRKSGAWTNLGEGLWTASSTAIYYNTGNVGIGTTTPGDKLHVAGGGIILDNNKFLRGKGTDGNAYAIIGYGTDDYAYIYGSQTGGVKFYDAWNVQTRMTVLTSGNVGIGTTGPNSKLEVAGTIHSTTGGIKFPDGTTQTTSGTSANKVTQVMNNVPGPLPLVSSNFTTSGGTLVVFASGSGWISGGVIESSVSITGVVSGGGIKVTASVSNAHLALIPRAIVFGGIPAGTYSITFSAATGSFDASDFFNATVLEIK